MYSMDTWKHCPLMNQRELVLFMDGFKKGMVLIVLFLFVDNWN